VSDYKRNFVHD